MDIKELESFKLSDAVKFHDKLNPALWTEKDELDPEVKKQLMVIAKDFLADIGVSSYKVEDITISGSNAAYSYTPHSDLDLHILVDYKKLPDTDVYKELFNAKKTVYNDKHDIKVHGVPVELYVQDSNQPHASLGEYSLLKNEWNKFPVKRRANFDQAATKLKYEKLGELIEIALKSKNLEDVDRVLDIVKRYRKAGLQKTGEFGPENLAFKAIRKQGLFQKLWDLKQDLRSRELSIENITEILDKESAAKVYWSQDNYMTGGKVNQNFTLHTAAAQDKNKNILKYNFYDFPKYSLTAVEFSRAVGPWGDSFSIDNAGDQYTVFATLIKTFTEYLSEHKPKYIMFGAKEPSRAKLYQTFVNRFASKFGYKQINPDSIPKPVSSMILNSGDTPFLLARTDLVKEVLDTQPGKTNKAKWDFSDPDMQELNFTASNGQQYRLDFLAPHIGPDEINQYNLLPDASDKYLDRGFFVQFEQVNKRSPWKQGKQGIEGTGAAAEIFGIVSNAILQFVKKKKPTYLYFQAAEQNRISLYSAMIKKLLPSLPGWKSEGPTSDGVFVLYSPFKKATKESSGYIPTEKEKNDPRFKTALTVDVKPDSIKKNAKAFGWNISRDGRPPLLRK